WNQALGCFTAVGELATSQGKKSSKSTAVVAATLMMLGSGQASAEERMMEARDYMTDCVVQGLQMVCIEGAKSLTSGSFAVGQNSLAGQSVQNYDLNWASLAAPETKTIRVGGASKVINQGDKFTSVEDFNAYLSTLRDNNKFKRTYIGKMNNIAMGTGAQAVGGRNISIGESAGAVVDDTNLAYLNSNESRNIKNQLAAVSAEERATYNWQIHNVNIGTNAGLNAKKDYSIAMGFNAGALNEEARKVQVADYTDATVFIGKSAGENNTSSGSVAIGVEAAMPKTNGGVTDKYDDQSVYIGKQAGRGTETGVLKGADGNGTYKDPNRKYFGIYRDTNDGLLAGSLENPGSPALTGINVGVGPNALWFAKGSANVGMGWKAGNSSTGSNNTYLGNISGMTQVGDFNVAVGNEAGGGAVSSRSVSVGSYAKANGDASVAVGSGAKAGSQDKTLTVTSGSMNSSGAHYQNNKYNDIAVGNEAAATGGSSIAMGKRAISNNDSSVAVGSNAEATGKGAISLGSSVGVTVERKVEGYGENTDTAIPDATKQSIASGDFSMAIGTASAASGNNAIAQGTRSSAKEMGSIALGYEALSTGDASLAASSNAKAYGKSDIAIGKNALAGDENFQNSGGHSYNTAIGQDAHATASQSTAIGTAAKAVGNDAVAVGSAAHAADIAAIAVGKGSLAQTDSSLAVGKAAQATGTASVAVGGDAIASGNNATVFGVYSKAQGASSTAVGPNAQATKNNAVAVGVESRATGGSSVATGHGAQAGGGGAIAIGHTAQATATNSISIGNGNIVSGKNSGAIGDPSTVSGTGSYSIGNDNTVATNDSFVLGSNVTQTVTNSVALGKDSAMTAGTAAGTKVKNATGALGTTTTAGDKGTVDTATVNGVTYSGFAGATANGVVSVGSAGKERRIQNVAAGEISATSTDAINGSQLYLVAKGLNDQMPVVYTTADGTKVYKKPDGTFVDESGTEVQPTDVIASMNNGEGSTTAPMALTNIAGNLDGAKANTAAPVTSGTAPAAEDINVNNAATVGDVLNAGWNLQGNGQAVDFVKPYDTVNFVDGANTTVSVTTADNLTNEIRVNVTNLPISYTNEAGDTLVKVGDNFYKASDVVDGKPKDDAAPQTPAGTTLVDSTGAAAPQTLDNVQSAINPDGSKTGDAFTTALNEAATNDPNKAVNVSDLKNATTTIIAKGTAYSGDVAEGDTNAFTQALGKETKVIGGVADKAKLSDNNIGVVSNGTDTLTIKLAKDLKDLDSATFGTDAKDQTVINKDGITIKGDNNVSLTDAGLDNGGNKIVNVAAGEADTDAVNISQLNKEVAKAKTTVTSNDGSVTVVKTAASDGHDNYDLSVDAQSVAENAQLPVVYTNKAGDKVYKQADGTFNTAKDGSGDTVKPADVIASMNNGDGSTTAPMTLTNIGSDLTTYTDAPKAGLVNLDTSDVKDSTAATVGDLRKMGWIVGAPGNDYTEQVKNANQVNFVGAGAAKVTGETKDGVRTITIDVKAPEGGMSGFDVTANDVNPTTITEGNKVNFIDGNNTKVTTIPKDDKSGVDVKVDLADNITVGKDGKNGVDGSIGATGKDGASAVLNGKDGSISLTGPKGADGKDGASATIAVKDGTKGLDGADGESKTRIVYTEPDGKTEEVATLNDGLSFAGDKGEVINKKLNEQLDIKGKAAADAEVTDKNIRVDSEEGALIIKMAKMLQDLEGAEFTDKDGNTVVVKDGGIVIKGKDAPDDKTVSLTTNGLNNGGNKITNVARGTDLTDAVNVEQLEEVKNQAGAGGFNVETNSKDTKKIGNGDTVDFVNGNNTTVSKVDTPKGVQVKVDLAKDLKGLNSVELKDPAGNVTNITGNGVNISGTNSAGNPSNVSLTANGLNNGGNRITNVAPGVKGTDAVNVNQLNAVGKRIGDVDRKARGGIAGSAAMANLPQAYIPGHSMVAVAASTHRGANAVALGVSRISDSGHVIIKLSGSADSEGGKSAGIGVGYQW
ncbi:YadA-like family protein, partial [Avibacterium avium]|uniref:YadA-like family protein n=1 Tax=Avibacterium avium TaxID=751 RepID=UPI003BF89C93